ncbi:protein of unknown function [Xenorhabdus poinarii G6]|uniref:Uncharacterized protein n=1 Tax=Xenorhabdus poinarii G6 TaxID=1354304 RepID=A0A068R2R3_9GAMM|nr:protein of unknown function [Xenorhabdus poinarii G6]
MRVRANVPDAFEIAFLNVYTSCGVKQEFVSNVLTNNEFYLMQVIFRVDHHCI